MELSCSDSLFEDPEDLIDEADEEGLLDSDV